MPYEVDVAAYILTYLEKFELQRTIETFVNESPLFRNTTHIVRPEKSLEQVLEEYALYRQTEVEVKQRGVEVVLNGLCDSLETVCRQVRCLTGLSQINSKPPSDQRARSRQANRNSRLTKSMSRSSSQQVAKAPVQHVDIATADCVVESPPVNRSLDAKDSIHSDSMASTVMEAGVGSSDVEQVEDKENEDASCEVVVIEEMKTGHYKSPKRKSTKPKRKEQTASLFVSASPHKVTVQDFSVGVLESEAPTDISCLLDTLLETKELQERLAQNINEGLGSGGDGCLDFVAEDDGNAEIVGSETVANIVERTESDPAFHSLFSTLGLEIPSTLDEEILSTDASDLSVPTPDQPVSTDVPTSNSTNVTDNPQPSHTNTCPSQRVIRTIALKQPTHVKRLNFGVNPTEENSSKQTQTNPTDTTKNVPTVALKRASNKGENNDNLVKKLKTDESTDKTSGEFLSSLDVDSFLATLNYSQ